jgi:hypothetical protein
MRKIFALVIVGLALSGGVAFVNIEKPTPAVACDSNNCD